MPVQHPVAEGDCVSTIAAAHGLFWKTVWEHPDNAELKKKRGDPNQLHEGDVVVVPERRAKQESGADSQKHRFKRKGVPILVVLRAFKPAAPVELPPECEHKGDSVSVALPDLKPAKQEAWAGVKYEATFGADTRGGAADGEGKIELKLPPSVAAFTLKLAPGTPDEMIQFVLLGALPPPDTGRGARRRLLALGYACQPEGPDDGADLADAIAAFQRTEGHGVTGRLSADLAKQLKEKFGC